jgi:hypothetical protein
MREDFQLRADDFRKAWPNALHRALLESSDLVKKLDEQRAHIEELYRMTPEVMSAARARLSEVTQDHLVQIEKVNAHYFEEQSKFMAALTTERQALERAMAAADVHRLDIATAERNLAKSRQEFNNLGLFKRLFAKA